MGLRYRKHATTLPGKPDIVFVRAKVVVFCDGDFWHGRNWESCKEKLGKGVNADYWVQKIAYNIERDQRNTKLLQDTGWTVIRLWETDIKFDPPAAAAYIRNVVDENRKARQLKSHSVLLDLLGNANEIR